MKVTHLSSAACHRSRALGRAQLGASARSLRRAAAGVARAQAGGGDEDRSTVDWDDEWKAFNRERGATRLVAKGSAA